MTFCRTMSVSLHLLSSVFDSTHSQSVLCRMKHYCSCSSYDCHTITMKRKRMIGHSEIYL